MSRPDAAALAATGGPRRGRRGRCRFFRSELAIVFGRRRNVALLVVLALVPWLIGTAVRLSGHGGRGGPGGSIFAGITDNGIFAALASYLVVTPLFLPLGLAVVAGDAVAGEASLGTLRYLLIAPVGRSRLIAVKFGAVLAWGAACVTVVGINGMAVGAALFPSGQVTLLSGRTVSYAAGTYRLVLVAAYLAAGLTVVGALGLLLSTLTEVPVAAMAATLVLTIVSEVLDQVPQLSVVHAWLPSHYWLQWTDLLRDPILTATIWHGLSVNLAYVAVLLSLTWARFTGSDVTA